MDRSEAGPSRTSMERLPCSHLSLTSPPPPSQGSACCNPLPLRAEWGRRPETSHTCEECIRGRSPEPSSRRCAPPCSPKKTRTRRCRRGPHRPTKRPLPRRRGGRPRECSRWLHALRLGLPMRAEMESRCRRPDQRHLPTLSSTRSPLPTAATTSPSSRPATLSASMERASPHHHHAAATWRSRRRRCLPDQKRLAPGTPPLSGAAPLGVHPLPRPHG
mmetsp:Transcript_92008/g.265475  ORF Transcript_92008/g.265475 Transcript_92008/m.265475 type:complete len:218 (-) Transcript_92008:160-813(-)